MIRLPFSYSHNGTNHCFLMIRERGNTVELLGSKGCRIMVVPDGATLASVLSQLIKGDECNETPYTKVLHKATRPSFYDATDEEIREHERKYGGIYVFYGFNNYNAHIGQLLELFKTIVKEYPDIKADDVEVWKIRESESRWVAHHTMLQFKIPADDFIRMRNSGEIRSL